MGDFPIRPTPSTSNSGASAPNTPSSTPSSIQSSGSFGRTRLSHTPVGERTRLWGTGFPQDLPLRTPQRQARKSTLPPEIRAAAARLAASNTPAGPRMTSIRRQTVPIARRYSERHRDVEGGEEGGCGGCLGRAGRRCRARLGDGWGIAVIVFLFALGAASMGFLIAFFVYAIWWLVTHT